mgnify:CR=1 FL=1
MEIKNRGSGKIFENPVLEFFTKSVPQVSVAIYATIIISFCILAYQTKVVEQGWVAASIFVSAVLSWTFFEYLLHRYPFHLDVYFPESKVAGKIAYTLHGIHHEYPRDRSRVIMPPIPGVLIASGFFGLFYLVMGSYAYIFLPGFLTGYLLYAFIHYGTHKFTPPKLLKPLWRHHALHHYKYPDKAFGISTQFWDRIFGTMPPAKTSRKYDNNTFQEGVD